MLGNAALHQGDHLFQGGGFQVRSMIDFLGSPPFLLECSDSGCRRYFGECQKRKKEGKRSRAVLEVRTNMAKLGTYLLYRIP